MPSKPAVATHDPSALITHDRLIMGDANANVSLLDRALHEEVRRCNVTLYRGLTKAEITDQGDLFVTHAYTMMTEKPNVALGQAAASGTDALLAINKAVALCYWEFLAAYRDDFVRAGVSDDAVDARIKRAGREREWIIAPMIKFIIDSTAPGSGTMAGRTVLTGHPADESNTIDEVLQGIKNHEARASVETASFEVAQPNELMRTVHNTIQRKGWVERHETWNLPGQGPEGNVLMHVGYTPEGHYLGNASEARYLVETRGFRPELRDPDCKVCTVAYCVNDGQWYGYSHRGIGGFSTRDEAAAFAKSVASSEPKLEEACMRRGEIAGEVPDRDSIFLQGNVMRKYDSMVMRRRTAALCDQPRVVQRLDRQLNILRAALGMEAMPPLPTRTSSRALDHNMALEGTQPQDPWDRDWMKSCTASGVAKWASELRDRGFAVTREVADDVHVWKAVGSEHGKGPATYELTVLDGRWCSKACRNGVDMGLFDTRSDEAITAIASEGWGGSLSGKEAQEYAKSWRDLLSAR